MGNAPILGNEASEEPKVTPGLYDDLDEASDNVNRVSVEGPPEKLLGLPCKDASQPFWWEIPRGDE